MTLVISTSFTYFYGMERDINLKLIYIILVLLIALVGISVFYQTRYDGMKSDYEKYFEDMNETIKNIAIKQKSLYSNISELNVSADREIALAQRLEAKSFELQNISRELASVQQQLFDCRQMYDETSTNCTTLDEVLTNHRESAGRLQGKIDRLEADVENEEPKSVILDDIHNLQAELNILKSY